MSEIKRKPGRPRKSEQAKNTALSTDDVKTIVKEKRRRNRPDLANFGQEFIEPGDNRKYITFAMESLRMPKLNFDNIDEVRERIEWYFTRCAEEDMKPGVVALANALGVDRATLWNWKTGERRADNPEFTKLIKQAYSFLEQMWENYMQNGKISPPNGIFLGKNNFGYKDVQDVVVQPVNPYGTDNPDGVRDKYIDGVQTETDIHADGEVK